MIIQCRLNSSRLPGKAALDLCGKPILIRAIERCRLARNVSDVVVATSDEKQDDIIESIAGVAGVKVFRGSLNNVRRRFLECAAYFEAETFIRVTADNPFVEPALIDALAEIRAQDSTCPYAVHNLQTTIYGIASELVDASVLKELEYQLPDTGREHVTTGLVELANARVVPPGADFSDKQLSLTVDTFDQYLAVWQLMNRFGSDTKAVGRILDAYRSGAVPETNFQVRP